MRINRLGLMNRMSKLADEQAGDTVRSTRRMLDEARHQSRMLDDYRRNLSIGHHGARAYAGQTLRGRAAFMGVAESACEQARHRVITSQQQTQEALQRWAEARRRTRVIEDKYSAARRHLTREQEKRAEKDRQ
jgi:flagellar biosynthesis chaperone FliJ